MDKGWMMDGLVSALIHSCTDAQIMLWRYVMNGINGWDGM